MAEAAEAAAAPAPRNSVRPRKEGSIPAPPSGAGKPSNRRFLAIRMTDDGWMMKRKRRGTKTAESGEIRTALSGGQASRPDERPQTLGDWSWSALYEGQKCSGLIVLYLLLMAWLVSLHLLMTPGCTGKVLAECTLLQPVSTDNFNR